MWVHIDVRRSPFHVKARRRDSAKESCSGNLREQDSAEQKKYALSVILQWCYV
jgi:hypothetical protein